MDRGRPSSHRFMDQCVLQRALCAEDDVRFLVGTRNRRSFSLQVRKDALTREKRGGTGASEERELHHRIHEKDIDQKEEFSSIVAMFHPSRTIPERNHLSLIVGI